ncbi:hypothetical protein A2U01_0025121 [Trifolium medium]|uniref:Transmembrane protein n=1 Tax=Trifolium medium TaxID=97028 RepID=A0A392NXZ9_9FABA|nr:hypothetical protein [Trifolium medium]
MKYSKMVAFVRGLVFDRSVASWVLFTVVCSRRSWVVSALVVVLVIVVGFSVSTAAVGFRCARCVLSVLGAAAYSVASAEPSCSPVALVVVLPTLITDSSGFVEICSFLVVGVASTVRSGLGLIGSKGSFCVLCFVIGVVAREFCPCWRSIHSPFHT